MKFEIFQSEKNQNFYFRLKADNGKIVLSSEGYSNKANCQKGVASVQQNAGDDAKYDKQDSESGKAYFNLKAANGQVIGKSQMYESAEGRDKGIESVKNATDAEIEDLTTA